MKLTEFGRLVRDLRTKHNLAMRDVAKELGVSVTFIGYLEVGKTQINEDWVEKISNYFNGYESIDKAAFKYAANITNQSINLKGLPHEQREMLAFLASQDVEDIQKVMAEYKNHVPF